MCSMMSYIWSDDVRDSATTTSDGLFDDAAPTAKALGVDALVIPSRTSDSVVQVEVLE